MAKDEYRNGLLYCGVCGGKKERYIEMFGKVSKVRCLCECGIIERVKREEEAAAYEKVRELELLRSASLMDSRLREATFDNFKVISEDSADILRKCSQYANNFSHFQDINQGFLFYGDCGTGKSFAAACIANSLLEKGKSVIMTSFVKILEMQLYKTDEKESNMIRQMCDADLLIIDDLGAERSTDYAIEKVYNVIDSRYRTGKPMIITTNMNLRDMIEETDIRYKRIYDRIFENCFPIEFKGKSRRRIEANERFKEMKKEFESGVFN